MRKRIRDSQLVKKLQLLFGNLALLGNRVAGPKSRVRLKIFKRRSNEKFEIR
jgi:hypothetical protein